MTLICPECKSDQVKGGKLFGYEDELLCIACGLWLYPEEVIRLGYKLTFSIGGDVNDSFEVHATREGAEADKAEAFDVMRPMLDLADVSGLEWSLDITETEEPVGLYLDGVLQEVNVKRQEVTE